MKQLKLILFCIIIIFCKLNNAFIENNNEILIPLGKIKGSFMQTRLGKRIFSFRGIRYAEPPTGENRFQPPVPIKSWEDIFDASKEGPSCPQPHSRLMSEDCLRLNIYTKELPIKKNITNKPVIVFFHPGSFFVRSGQSYQYGPQYLMDKDIVLVTVNYRLASLGFMSTGDSLLPGNLGLKDQVAALRWIKNNIEYFGGDANCVTITGQSAGARSVTLHLVSPMSNGLFHRIIALSGSGVNPEPLPHHQRHLAKKQAQILNCPSDNVKEMLGCMKNKTQEEFGNSLSKFFEWYGDPIVIWRPVVEPEIPGVERFLTDQPANLIRKGQFHHVPVIAGVTKDEFAGIIKANIERAQNGNFATINERNDNWEYIAPISFSYERNSSRSKYISKELRKFYLNDLPISLDNINGLGEIYADSITINSVHRFVNLLAATSTKPVYYYKFTYQGRYSHTIWKDSKKPFGVVHEDDLIYLFFLENRFPMFNETDPEVQIIERMTSIWENFAITGNPIPEDNLIFENVTWQRFTPSNKCYLDIGSELIMKNGNIYPDRMQLWDKLFPLPLLTEPRIMARFNLVFLYLFIIVCNLNFIIAKDKTLVSISLGKIKGSFMQTRLGKEIYSYRGIRYAEPPVGELRFQQAVPVKPWENILDASKEGPACPQMSINFTSEDCLRLNVYTKELPTGNQNASQPVIVFFHPGGFYAGSAQSTYHGPQYLLDRNLVLVTVNYRLASLGFISAGHPLLPGNNGFKDQVVALKWVKEHISNFGGNPNCVTIAGQSAGSWSAALHMMSPMSKGLFHRVISMSGSPVKPEPLPSHQKNLAIKQAQILNCPTDNIEEMVKCLKTKPAEEFGKSFPKFNEWYGDPILRWRPVVEPKFPGIERFLTDDPANLIRKGKFQHVPFFGGVTKDEFAGVIKRTIERARQGNTSTIDERNANWDEISPISFLYQRGTPRSKCISHELKKFYLNDQPVSLDNILNLGKIYADAVTIFSHHRLVTLLAAANKKPTYYYKFSYQGRYSHVIWEDTKKPFGVVHHDELIYLFGIAQFPAIKENDPELLTLERMTAIWENFAKTGEPIPEENSLFENVTWNPITASHPCYLEMNNEFIMRNGIIYLDRMHFWEKLFPLQPLTVVG
ncbi:uncharacterized protein LOC127283823 [Leptopilina boulardi]|uniref:uncharacterized protein LOC127283823 n=1 Tax=Leptopilina boulardi TaxID=63433 RepID=UPI0021F5354A|nr:uncharacterized protein LOC127283823 [Leptopilina boulardi]